MYKTQVHPAIVIKLFSMVLCTLLNTACLCQKAAPNTTPAMSSRYFTKAEFNNELNQEITLAKEVYQRMANDEFKEYALATFDIEFTSNTPQKLHALSAFLTANYGFTMQPPEQEEDYWIITGTAVEQPYTQDNLLYWVIDLYCKGYQYDCRFLHYGTLTDAKHLAYQNLSTTTADSCFNKGIDALNNSNFGAAIIQFTTALRLNSSLKTALQARGYCKDELHASKAARKDYDLALAIDPNYVDALLLRATNKDDAGEHAAALTDYNKVIALAPDNHLAYFNRGNTQFSLGNKQTACHDWATAKQLGSPYAQQRIDAECK